MKTPKVTTHNFENIVIYKCNEKYIVIKQMNFSFLTLHNFENHIPLLINNKFQSHKIDKNNCNEEIELEAILSEINQNNKE